MAIRGTRNSRNHVEKEAVEGFTPVSNAPETYSNQGSVALDKDGHSDC
jgi:hypothetical protein